MRIAHYLNQFFGGLGGEEQAGAALETRAQAVGPGQAARAGVRRRFAGGADARVRR